MKFWELVLRVAREEIEDSPEFLGFRLSPVRISVDQAQALGAHAQSVLGEKVFVAISVPGAPLKDGRRVFLAPDARAAERATEWRNMIHPALGEHLLYVSAETHGRAGGLRDCLHPIHEVQLRKRFETYCLETDSPFPTGFGEGFRDSGLSSLVAADQLCEFSEACTEGGTVAASWKAVGQSLPVLSLARDGALSAENTAERLRANAELIAQVSTRERQRSRILMGEHAGLWRRLCLAVEGRHPLGDVDIGVLATSDLLQLARMSRKTQRRISAESREPTDKTAVEGRTVRAKKKRKKTRGEGKADKEPQTPDGGAGDRMGGENSADGERSAIDQKFATSVLDHAPRKRAKDAERRSQRMVGNPKVWDQKAQRKEFGQVSLPEGTRGVLSLLARGNGDPLEVSVRGELRRCLEKLPKSYEHGTRDFGWEDLTTPLEVLRKVRASLVAELADAAGSPERGLERLAIAPLLMLADSEIRGLAEQFLAAWRDLADAVWPSSEPEPLRAVLNRETVLLRSLSGECLLLLSPLHPLWLSQAVLRYEALLSEGEADEVARQLVARALAVAPVAPQKWLPVKGPWMKRGLSANGLPTYDFRQKAVPPSQVRHATTLLLQRLLELEPYAALSLRLRVSGREAQSVVDGLTDVILTNGNLEHVEVQSDQVLDVAEHGPAREIVDFIPIASDGSSLAEPHLWIVADPEAIRIADEEPTAPDSAGHASGTGPTPTRFLLRDGTLHVETPVLGEASLGMIERILARLDGRLPRGVFTHSSRAISLGGNTNANVGGKLTWRAVVAPNISGSVPVGQHLLAKERLAPNCEVAVLSASIDPASRWLETSLKRLGVGDLRPRTLRALALRLAGAGTSGVVSLESTGDRLLALGTLALAMREGRGPDMLVAPVEGDAYRTLLGRDPKQDGSAAFVICATGDFDDLRVVVGFAATGDVELKTRGSRLSGPLAEALERLISVIRHAVEAEGLAGAAAREELGWVLWPAVVRTTDRQEKIADIARAFCQGAKLNLSVRLLLPSEHGAARARTAMSLGQAPVAIQALSPDLLEQFLL